MFARENVRRLASDRFFVLAVVALAGAKMALIWGNETVPEGSDSVLYLGYARDLFWGTSRFPFRGPGYPLWIALCQAIHIPLRLATEGLLLATAGAFVSALRPFRCPSWLLIAIYTSIAFHPATFNIVDQPMSEGFFSCISFVSLALFFAILSSTNTYRQIVLAVAFGVSVALLLHTRGNDALPIYGFTLYAIVTILVVTLLLRRTWLGFKVSGYILAGLFIVHLSVLGINYIRYGYFAENEILSSGQKSVLHEMMLIDTGETVAHPFIAVTNKARQIAYELSPTLRTFKTAIEDGYRPKDLASSWGSVSRTGVKDQIDIQSTLDFLSAVVRPPEIPGGRTPVQLLMDQDALHSQIAREIDEGLKEGNVKRRFIVYMWNPFSLQLYKRITESSWRLTKGLLHVERGPAIENYPFIGSLVAPLYDQMATRRQYLVEKGPLSGFMAVRAPRKIEAASFVNDTFGFFARQGVPDYLKSNIGFIPGEDLAVYADMGAASLSPLPKTELPARWIDNEPGEWTYYKFSFFPFHDRFFLDFGKLILKLDDGVNVDFIAPSFLNMLKAGNNGDEAQLLVTSYEAALRPFQRINYEIQLDMVAGFDRFAPSLVLVAAGLALAARLIGTVMPRVMTPSLPETTYRRLALAAILMLIVERIIFYGLMDVTIVQLNDDRHLFAANILALPAIFMLLYEVGTLTWVHDLKPVRWARIARFPGQPAPKSRR